MLLLLLTMRQRVLIGTGRGTRAAQAYRATSQRRSMQSIGWSAFLKDHRAFLLSGKS